MSGRLIRKVEKRDIPKLSEVLALAFDGDPAIRWATREDRQRLPALIDFFTYWIEDAFRYNEETTTEDLHACAIWVPPQASEKTPILNTLRMLPRYIKWCGYDKLGRWFKFIELFEKKRPTVPHYYLDFIGVHPDYQGRGYASQLLQYSLAHIDAQAIPAYLESTNPKNNALYQRKGFQIIDEINLPKGPKIWCMWRETQKN